MAQRVVRAKTSYSELSTLARCEQLWSYKYRQGRDDSGSKALHLGRLLGEATAVWWKREPVDAALDGGFEAINGYRPALADWQSEPLQTAVWLLDRYDRHYAGMRDSVKVVSVEQKVSSKLPGTRFTLRGYVDRIFEIDGKLWAVEAKTMSDWSRLDILTVDPQLTLYDWMLKDNGFDIYGLLFDAIRTYRWAPEKPTQGALIAEREARDQDFAGWLKKAQTEWAREAVANHPGTERPPSESFQQLWLDRTPQQHEGALAWAKAGLKRRQALVHGAIPIRNINHMTCRSCPHQEPCFEEMAFPLGEIELVED